MILTKLFKPVLPVLAGCLAFTMTPLRAADKKEDSKEEKGKAEEAGGTTLSQFRLGEAIANGPVSEETVTGKVVVLEFWGIH